MLTISRWRHGIFFGLVTLFMLTFLVTLGWGAVSIAPGDSLAILSTLIGFDLPETVRHSHETVLLAIRLPRTCLAIIAGASLAVCGAVLQGLFRNPLADPALIGVSNGAALAAVGVIVLGSELLTGAVSSVFLLPLAAFVGGLATTFFVYKIASRGGYTDAATLLLAGVALNAITASGIGLLIFISTDQQLRDLSFWLLGSLGGITWTKLLAALPFIALALALLPWMARPLNALLLGEQEAWYLGFRVETTKRLIILLVALATGACVALTGVIGFVGLIVPHVVRLLVGPDHRVVLPASVLLGASLMMMADFAARMLVIPAELPIGILTGCVGGPLFLWLLLHRRSWGGGYATGP